MSGAVALLSLIALVISLAFLPGVQLTGTSLFLVILLGMVFFGLYILLPALYVNETLIALITYIASQVGQYGILILFLYFIIIAADALKYPLSEYVTVVLLTVQAAFFYILLWSPFSSEAKIGIMSLFLFCIISMGIFIWYFSNQILHEQSLRVILERKSKYLKAMNDHLTAVDHMRTNVLNVTSHEFQTPLSIINNSLSIIRDDADNLTPTQLKYIKSASINNERIIHLVKDLLSTARMESGEWKLVLRRADVTKMIQDLADEYRTICESAKLTFHIDVPKEPLYLDIDQSLIRIACKNLLENATRYTKPGGSITVALHQTAAEVTISVADTGIGIDHQAMKHLFTQFSRSDQAILAQPDGFGIGLHYSRTIVRRHKGDITVTSTEGKGSTFVIHLPNNEKSRHQQLKED